MTYQLIGFTILTIALLIVIKIKFNIHLHKWEMEKPITLYDIEHQSRIYRRCKVCGLIQYSWYDFHSIRWDSTRAKISNKNWISK